MIAVAERFILLNVYVIETRLKRVRDSILNIWDILNVNLGIFTPKLQIRKRRYGGK